MSYSFVFLGVCTCTYMCFYPYSFSLHGICMFLQVFVLNSWSLFTCSKCFIPYALKFYFKTVLMLNCILLLIRFVPPLHWSLSFAQNYLTTESGTSTNPVFSIISYIVCFLNMYMWFPFFVEWVTGMDIYFNMVSFVSPDSSVHGPRQEYVYKIHSHRQYRILW